MPYGSLVTCATIGSQIKGMTDKDIIDVFNGVMAAQETLLEGWDRTVTEMLPGAPQIEYRKDLDQIVPLAEVIRCYVDDGGQDGEVTVHIDGNELSLAEFGQLLKSYAGWGMRVTFVPEERLTRTPLRFNSARRNLESVETSSVLHNPSGRCRRRQLRKMYP